jgi:drug/metabolite transporter (DMT)-like permease
MSAEPTPRGRAIAALAALACVVIWAVNYPAMKLAYREFHPLAYTGWRFVMAAAILVAWALAEREPVLPPRGSRGLALFMALSGVGVYQWFFALGVAKTSSFAAALLNAVSPLLSLLFVWLLGVEPMTRLSALGSVVAYLGVAVFVRTSHGGDLGGLAGNLLCLGSAACWAAYNVAASRSHDRMSPATAQASTFLLGTIVVVGYGLPSMVKQDYGKVSLLSYTILVLSAILPLALAFRLWSHALKVLGVATSTSLAFLVPVVAGISSALMTGERFTLAKVASAGVVLTGLALTRLGRRGAP